MNKEQEKEFIEAGAKLEHDRWARWQAYLHSKLSYSEIKREGKTIACYIMDAGDFEHWESQIDRDYFELSEKEKDSDRKEVREYLPFINKLLKKEREETQRDIETVIGMLNESTDREQIKNYIVEYLKK